MLTAQRANKKHLLQLGNAVVNHMINVTVIIYLFFTTILLQAVLLTFEKVKSTAWASHSNRRFIFLNAKSKLSGNKIWIDRKPIFCVTSLCQAKSLLLCQHVGIYEVPAPLNWPTALALNLKSNIQFLGPAKQWFNNFQQRNDVSRRDTPDQLSVHWQRHRYNLFSQRVKTCKLVINMKRFEVHQAQVLQVPLLQVREVSIAYNKCSLQLDCTVSTNYGQFGKLPRNVAYVIELSRNIALHRWNSSHFFINRFWTRCNTEDIIHSRQTAAFVNVTVSKFSKQETKPFVVPIS